MNKQKQPETPKDTAQRLLTPKKTLAPFVFDKNAVMYEDLRLKLIDAAKIVFEHTAAKIEGVEIEDIYLIGSLAGYQYHVQSDFDIAITLNFDNAPFIKQTNKTNFTNYLIFLYAGSLNYIPQFYIGNRMADINLKVSVSREAYSLLQNQWKTKIEPDYYKSYDVDGLLSRYYDAIEQYNNFLKQLKTVNGKYSLEDCKKMQTEVFEILHMRAIDNREQHIVFKMLNDQNIISDLAENAADSLRYKLSLYGSPKD